MSLTKRQEMSRLTVAETELRLANTIIVNALANIHWVDGAGEAADALLVVQRLQSRLRMMVIELERQVDGR